MKSKKKKRHLKKEVIWILHGIIFVTVAVVMGRRVLAAPKTAEVVIECGEALPDPAVFFTHEVQDAAYATAGEMEAWAEKAGVETQTLPDTHVLGAHRVFLTADGKLYPAVLIVEDTSPPVIEGVSEQTVQTGETVSFKRGVSVTDNHDETVGLVVDASAVDLSSPGDYIVSFYATDMAGNEASAQTLLHVVSPQEEQVSDPYAELSEEERRLFTYADEVLSGITTEDMSPYDKARAIYDWVHEIEYIHIYEEQTDFENAMQGFTRRMGDCHVYEATARVLLTRGGIETVTVSNIPPAVAHAWNLINLGEGWRHFDATRRYQEADLFYLTDEELMAYSSAHAYTHLFDRSLYPAAE